MFYKHLVYLVQFYQKKAKQAVAASPPKKKGLKDKGYPRIFDKLARLLQSYTTALKKDQPSISKLLS